MDMKDDDDNRGNMHTSTVDGPSMGPVYLMWENTYEKLKILQFPKLHQYHRLHFVIPMKNVTSQYDDFVDLFAWISQEIAGKKSAFQRDQYDDPNTISNKIILALRQLEYKTALQSQKLRNPFGEIICHILEFLVDKLLSIRGFKVNSLVYIDAQEVEDVVDDAQDDEVEDIGEEIEDDFVYREGISEIHETSIDQSTHNILQAMIDPIEWKTELERVTPKLKAHEQLSIHEWRSHVDQTLTSHNLIEKVLQETNGNLLAMNKLVSDEVNHMKMKEKYLSHQFAATCTQYQEIKKRVEELEKTTQVSNQQVKELQEQLNDINDKLDEMKESFDSKDSNMNDTSPLVKMKTALQIVKEEIKDFHIRIGISSSTLLSCRISSANQKRLSMNQKKYQRRNLGYKRNNDIDDQSI